MKTKILSVLIAGFLVGACAKEESTTNNVNMATETQETLKAAPENGYIGHFWNSDWYWRCLYEEYLGGGEFRRFCTAPPAYSCIVAVYTHGTTAPPPDPDPDFVAALNEIIEEQNESDIIDFFTAGLGFDNFQFLDDVDPSYLAGLQNGSKTIIRANSDGLSPKHLFLVVDYGVTTEGFDINEDEFYAIQF